MKLIPKISYIKKSAITSVIGFLSGLVILVNPVIGVVLFIIDLIVDAKIMETMDTKEIIEKTKIDVLETKKEIDNLLEETKKTKEEIDEMKEKIFNVFSKRGHLTIEERVSELEKKVGFERNHDSLEKKIEELEDKWKRMENRIQELRF